MRPHSQPSSDTENGLPMTNVAKLQKALEAAENMTDKEYCELYEQAKDLHEIVTFEEFDYLAKREKLLKVIHNAPKL